MPITAVKQLFDPLQLALTHRIGDVGFVHNHTLYGHQAVVKRSARVIIGTTCRNQINRLATGRTGTYPLEVMARHTVVKISMGEKQVLV